MTTVLAAFERSDAVPEEESVAQPDVRSSWGEMLTAWGHPSPIQDEPLRGVGYRALAEPVVRRLTSHDAVRTLILATVFPDWTPVTQPAVGLLPSVQHGDPAVVSAWSLTEDGLLGPFAALRLAQLRMSRVGGDALVVAADRQGLPYRPGPLPEHRRTDGYRAVGVRMSTDEHAAFEYVESGDPDLLARRAGEFAEASNAARLVVGGDTVAVDWTRVGLTAQRVAPGFPATGALSEACSAPGRVVCGVWDPELARGCVLLLDVR